LRSTKSFAYVAPAFPPPAYTWLTTTPGDAPTAAGATTASNGSAMPRRTETRFMGGSDLMWTRCVLVAVTRARRKCPYLNRREVGAAL
jgi:hypothetical protein